MTPLRTGGFGCSWRDEDEQDGGDAGLRTGGLQGRRGGRGAGVALRTGEDWRCSGAGEMGGLLLSLLAQGSRRVGAAQRSRRGLALLSSAFDQGGWREKEMASTGDRTGWEKGGKESGPAQQEQWAEPEK